MRFQSFFIYVYKSVCASGIEEIHVFRMYIYNIEG